MLFDPTKPRLARGLLRELSPSGRTLTWNLAWLALQNEEILAVQAYYPVASEPNNLLSDDGWIELAAATTLPAVRGQGIGRALTAHGLHWARGAGYTVCLSDWRATNLLASRFWPRRGFEPVYYRLERRIDPRVAWARVD